MTKQYNIDRNRVYATGISNGAFFINVLAAQRSDKIAAIAPVAPPVKDMDKCHPRRAVPILHFHGTADNCAKYNGAENCGGCFSDFFGIFAKKEKPWACDPVPDVIDTLADTYTCKKETSVSYTKGAVECVTHSGCRDNAEITLCTIKGGGHSWPGGNEDGVCFQRPHGILCKRWRSVVGGEPNHDINASEMAWAFFSHYHLP